MGRPFAESGCIVGSLWYISFVFSATYHFNIKWNWDYAEFVSLQVNIQQPDLRKQNVPCSLPYGHAVLNDSNNIEWHASLGPDTELELKLIYSVESPLQDGVEGLPKS